jgi:hypothetical protein
VLSLPISQAAVESHAVDAANINTVIDDRGRHGERKDTGVELLPDEDVVVGIWNPNADPDTPKFRELQDDPKTTRDERRSANAVQTVARRIEARDNPIPLIIAPAIGKFSQNEERRATAYITGGPSNFAFVGIDWVRSNGNGATVDSLLYGRNGTGGGVASDGDINLGNGDVYGDARPGIGASLKQGPNSIVTGWTANLDYKLAERYPPVTDAEAVGATVVTGYKKNQPLTLAGSNDKNASTRYLLQDSLDHPDPLKVTGYVILYVDADIDVQGSQLINATSPAVAAMLEIRVIGSHSVDLGGNATQFAHVYAPQSTVKVHGTPGFTGTIVGKTLEFIGTSKLHYDDSKDDKHAYHISIVR